MSAVEQIVEAVKRLSPGQFERLRKRLELLEQERWESERQRVGEEFRIRGITDADIDRAVVRRRREGRV